jgi:hypothetical protein
MQPSDARAPGGLVSRRPAFLATSAIDRGPMSSTMGNIQGEVIEGGVDNRPHAVRERVRGASARS